MSRDHTQACPVARSLNIFGDHWTMLIIREFFYGASRFKQLQQETGIAKNLLSERLKMLVEQGIVEKTDVGERGTRFAYSLTAKGESLFPVLVCIFQWGNRELYGSGNQPAELVEKSTNLPIAKIQVMSRDGRLLDRNAVKTRFL
ncbi:MAG: helix-turn-helix domain-containing protein [Pseudomonadota bacterium]